ncbi:energy transducer TonB [Bradyrhizobium lablabi]|uniref:Energy transducer TonB n=2 Tax=Bradyrhizobium lablabi TaxID=722472 RepID=A0A0R3MDK4_9BRAD|nr:energy transducer TonB [Bradyrhizobium lablabi]
MNAFALHDVSDQAAVRRWGASAFAIVAAHLALIALAMNWQTSRPEPGVSMPAIMIDLAPVTSSPETAPMDITPGPEMQQADASPPEPAAEAVQEQIAPPPPQEKPEVVAPPEQKQQPTPEKPEPAKVVPEQKPVPVKPKVVRPDARKPSEAPPAPRTSAPPRAERQAPAASAISAGAAASAMAAYSQRVRAHLMRFHQYPSSGNGQRGVARLSFTLSRSGQVQSSRLGGSSGVSAFDAQAMAMIRQAAPFPAFPPEITYATMPFNVPVEFMPR